MQLKNKTWTLTLPDGTTHATTYDGAMEYISSASVDNGSEVRLLDEVGLIYRVLHFPPASQAPAGATPAPPHRGQRGPAPATVMPAVTASAAAAPEYRLFLQSAPTTTPYTPWGDWRVRPGRADSLEIEATREIAGHSLTIVAYLTADKNHYGVNAFANMGGMLNAAWSQRQALMASPTVRQSMQGSGCLAPLLTEGSFDDAGMGTCSLRQYRNGPELAFMLLWQDGQRAPLGATAHTRFLVHRTFHMAATVIAELLVLQHSLASGPHAPEQAKPKSVWDETASTLDWLDTNLTRVSKILDTLGAIFDF